MASGRRVSELTDHLGYWLRFVSNHVSQTFARRVEAEGVSVAEWVLLRHLLDAETLAPSRVAERMGMTRGGVTKLADRLIARRLVVRTADPRDGRAQSLSLTAAGRRLVPRLAALADANDKAFFAGLGAEDRAALRRILQAIVERQGLAAEPVD